MSSTRHSAESGRQRASLSPRSFSAVKLLPLGCALLLGFILACTESADPQGQESKEQKPKGQAIAKASADFTGPWFVDRAKEADLDFTHFNGMTGERLYSEMMGSGVAFFDFDNDGDLDIYAVQAGMVDPDQPVESTIFPAPPSPWIDRLFRNELIPQGTLRFTDATANSGIVADGYGMGVTVGDVDNDGFQDLYVMNDGPDQLWRNRGDGTFEDHTSAAGLSTPGWSVSAAFLDFDRDGFLDLFVVYYVDFSVDRAKPCKSLTGRIDYCGPLTHPPVADRLYRNRGDGTFEEVTRRSGLLVAPPAAGLGVAVLDFNRDGRLDLAVANDGMPNHLWRNNLQPDGSGGFEQVAALAGISVNQEGQAEAGMGIIAGDPDSDGDEDLLLTHLALETHTFYRNDGGGFSDRTQPSGIGAPSWNLTSFGVGFLDIDLDGRLEPATVSGGVKIITEQLDAGDPHPLKMHKQLYRNVDGQFKILSPAVAGEPFARPSVGRGLAVGDVDNDGDPDLLVSNNAGPLELLINRFFDPERTRSDRSWVGLQVLDRHGREALGAVCVSPSLSPQLMRVGTDGSYASAQDPRLVFGVRKDGHPPKIKIRWINGLEETFEDLKLDRYVTLREGEGQSVDAAHTEAVIVANPEKSP